MQVPQFKNRGSKALSDLQISHFGLILPPLSLKKEEDCTFCAAPKRSAAAADVVQVHHGGGEGAHAVRWRGKAPTRFGL